MLLGLTLISLWNAFALSCHYLIHQQIVRCFLPTNMLSKNVGCLFQFASNHTTYFRVERTGYCPSFAYLQTTFSVRHGVFQSLFSWAFAKCVLYKKVQDSQNLASIDLTRTSFFFLMSIAFVLAENCCSSKHKEIKENPFAIYQRTCLLACMLIYLLTCLPSFSTFFLGRMGLRICKTHV